MAKDTKGLQGIFGKFEGISTLKDELMVRFALMGHLKNNPAKSDDPKHVDQLVELVKINREIDIVSEQVRQFPAGAPNEVEALERLRALEDARFQMLSEMNGDHLNEYNDLTRLKAV